MNLENIVLKVECGSKVGSAFLINSCRVITAFHVVSEYKDSDIFLIGISGEKIKATLSSSINDHYKKLDVALLILEKEIEVVENINFVSYEEIPSGTKWISRGYPESKVFTGDNLLEDNDNVVNQHLNLLRNGKIDIELEHKQKLSTYAGYSGAPILIDGDLIGLINQELVENSQSKELTGLTFKHFSDLLKAEGLNPILIDRYKNNPLKNILSNEWFSNHIKNSISNIGARYSPEINVELDVKEKIYSILKKNNFYKYSRQQFHLYLLNTNKLISEILNFNKKINNSCLITLLEDVSKIKEEIKSNYEDFISDPALKFEIKNFKEKHDYLILKIKNVLKFFKEIFPDEKLKNDYYLIISQFSNYLNEVDEDLKLVNNPYLLLKGKAGVGKSHLLADVILEQHKDGVPSIFLLGQHFIKNESPWSQILKNILRLDCHENDLLHQLNEIGMRKRKRILFAIDAINEGNGNFFWVHHINSFINSFKEFPWISLVITLRDTYEKKLLPSDFAANTNASIFQHNGFTNHSYEAVLMFFNYYKIELPQTPIFNSEFSNPLFLKLFCEGLFKRGLNRIPEGYGGISSVLKYFTDNIDIQLGNPNRFEYEPSANICRKVIDQLISYKHTNNSSFVPYDDACDICNQIISRYSNKKGLVDSLIHEGLLSKNLYLLEEDEYIEGVYFSYERLEDHFFAQILVKNNLSKDNINTILKKSGELYYLIKNNYKYQGLIESLSIIIPEKFECDLFTLLDDIFINDDFIIEAFIYSLYWRKKNSITEVSHQYINEVIYNNDDSYNIFVELIYSVSGDTTHPFNGSYLNEKLYSMPINVRDAKWTIFLAQYVDSKHGIFRLLDWINFSENFSSLSESSLFLLGKSICWLFTTTNIELRNYATKSLGLLLINNLNISKKLLEIYIPVNDPYVLEHTLASIYGSILNSDQLVGLKELSQYLLQEIFLQKEVYPNVLIRDYARNIIEYALFKKYFQLDEPNVIIPPYKSTLPTRFPSNDEVDQYKFDYKSTDFKSHYWSQNAILSSMVTEYGRGVGAYGDFGRYTFESALDIWGDKIDTNLLSNYACYLIFNKFEYDVEKHGFFDHYLPGSDRFDNKIERIGKKYQWLAMYEIIARIADNIEIKKSNNFVFYEGPWQNWLRKFDPTDLPFSKEYKSIPISLLNPEYNFWQDDDRNWLISEENLIDPKSLIAKHNFLSLESSHSWSQGSELGVDRDSGEGQNLWIQIRSYLVKKDDYEYLKSWLFFQDLMGRWMPESTQNYSIFSKEYFWSPAYKSQTKELEHENNQWLEVRDRQNCNRLIASVLPTTEEHIWEGRNNKSFYSVRDEMFHGMNLNISRVPSCLYNDIGELACFDPSCLSDSTSELLINQQIFESYLLENNFEVIWTVLGEKQLLGSFNHLQSKWLDFSGVYTLENNKLVGSIKTRIKRRG